jgi:hypothetical protein
MKIVSRRLPLKMWHRLAHRVGRSSQATPAAVDKSLSASNTKIQTSPGFELPSITPGVANFSWLPQATVPGWRTTAGDGLIEIWSDGFGGFPSYEGTQHAEINATQVGTLYQDVAAIPAGVLVGFQFAHRGRYPVADVMQFTLTDLGPNNVPGGGDDTVLFTQTVSDTNSAWRLYTGSGILTLGNTVRFSFASVSSGGGVPDGGNFIDAADFGFGVGGGGGGAVTAIPTLQEWSLIFLALLLAGAGGWYARRPRRSITAS